MKETITSRQFMLFVLLFSIGTSIIFIPGNSTEVAKQDAWIGVILGIVIGSGCVYLYIKLADLHQNNQNFFEWCESLLGKWGGIVVSFYCITLSLVGGASTLFYYVSDFMITHIIPETPPAAINVLFAAFIIMGLKYGLPTLGRASEILIVVIIFLFIVLLVFVSPQIKMENIQPFMQIPFENHLLVALQTINFAFLPMFTLLAIYPAKVTRKKHTRKSFMIGALIGSSMFLLITIVCILVLGPKQVSSFMYPSYMLAKKINIANFLTRLEIIFAALWLIALYFKSIIYLYFTLTGIAYWLKLKDYRSILIPLVILTVYYSLTVYPDSGYQIWWDSKIWPVCALIAGVGIPCLLLFLSLVKKKTSHH